MTDPRARTPEPAPRAGLVGVVLAAGAGRRAGGPKALRFDPDGTSWLRRAVGVLRDAGCSPVVTVLGCGAAEAAVLLAGEPGIVTVIAGEWELGLSASLAVGLRAVDALRPTAVAVHLVDLPDVTAEVVRRVIEAAGAAPDVLARATYARRPGHPVLIGAEHLAALLRELDGDEGARGYLERHGVRGVECGDLASGRDVDQRASREGTPGA